MDDRFYSPLNNDNCTPCKLLVSPAWQHRLMVAGLLLPLLWCLGAVLLPDSFTSTFAQYRNPYNPYLTTPADPFEESWYQYRVAQQFFYLLIGGLIGAFSSDRLREFRKLLALALVVSGGALLISQIIPIDNVVLFIIGFAGARWLLRDIIDAAALAAKQQAEKATTFGSAEWADAAHLIQNKLTGDTGLKLGIYEGDGRSMPLHYTGNRHLLTVAPTRSGKGVAAIIPNLLTYEGSALIIDPKGENARITAARRGAGDVKFNIPGMKQDSFIVDPWRITGLPVARFNPLDWLKPDDDDISENAMMLADSIVVPHSGGKEEFWDEEAKALLMGVLLYVALDEYERENRNLGRVRDIITSSEDKFMETMERMVQNTNPIVITTAERTVAKDPKLRSNVVAALQSHTHFLDSPRIRESLSASDFRFEDMKTSRMTVYLVLPVDRLETFGRWLRLLVQQAITVNARNIEVIPDKPILFFLDELAALGRLTMVEQAYGLMAGFGMQLWGIVQDLGQLERICDKGWETFISNAGVVQYFGSRDVKTSEYFSKLCGVTTVRKFSLTNAVAKVFGFSSSSSSAASGGSSTSGTSSSTTYSDSYAVDVVQRHLAFPDELMVLRDDKQLVFIENFNPIPGKRVRWHDHPTLRNLGVNLMNPQQPRTPVLPS